MYAGPGNASCWRQYARIDLRRLQHVMAAALRLLAKGSLAPLSRSTRIRRQQLVLVHQPEQVSRGSVSIPFQRHPVEGVVGIHIEPFVETLLVDQPRLADDEVDQFLIRRDCILQRGLR